jgi:hypothetical protein
MSKTKLLLDVINDIKSLSNSMQELADVLSDEENIPAIPKAEELSLDTSKTKSSKSKVTLEEVRAVLARKSQDGFTQQIQSIIQGFGAKKLSEVDPKHYEEMINLAEGLKND